MSFIFLFFHFKILVSLHFKFQFIELLFKMQNVKRKTITWSFNFLNNERRIDDESESHDLSRGLQRGKRVGSFSL